MKQNVCSQIRKKQKKLRRININQSNFRNLHGRTSPIHLLQRSQTSISNIELLQSRKVSKPKRSGSTHAARKGKRNG